jgi:hypothetical protein
MKRGHAILIGGGVLLISGIIISAIWAVSFAGSFLQESVVVAETTIASGESVSTRIEVNQLDNPITLAIGVEHRGQLQQQQGTGATISDVRVRATITDPNGQVVSSNEFGNSFSTSFRPEIAGAYTVTVTNLAANPVTVGGAFGGMPFVGADGVTPDMNAIFGAQGFGMIIAGGVLASVGIVTIIIGGIITAIDSRKEGGSGPTTTTGTTSEGGITYRKD